MKLAEWITTHQVKRTDFAARIGVSPSYITALCQGHCWPSRDVVARIMEATSGAVQPNDFFDAPAPEAAE